uniref:Centromere protein I n=1 Tax=Xenopus tropicalis TaxID=8364 RepID=A0A6I8QHR0_XENTR
MEQKQPRRSQHRESMRNQDANIQQMEEALLFLKNVKGKVILKENHTLINHIFAVENFGLKHGIPPDAINVLLNLVLSGNLADSLNARLLKCLIPASEVTQSSIIQAVSLFCAGKCSANTQIMFLRWLITVFDYITCKDILSSFYNFFFCFLNYDNLCPYLCHLLYLLTKKDHVRPFRVRKLMELQNKKGLQPHLLGLLSIYKIFCPELVSLTLPSRFKKWNSNPLPPVHSSIWGKGPVLADNLVSNEQTFPIERLQTFPQLLDNIHRLELPAQMGSVLKSPLLLHYVNCIKDDTPFLRLNYWLAFTLHEECAWYKGNKRSKEEIEAFLETVANMQQFLQEGLYSTEGFLYKSLPHWNGSHQSHILDLISWIPMSPSSEMEELLYKPLAQLFISSSVYFKCSILESLKALLHNWLVWHSVSVERIHTQSTNMNGTMSGLLTSVKDLIHFIGRLSTLGLQIHNSNLLLHFVLDIYELVSDMYVKFSLPLVVLPPPGVFYPALLSTDCVNLNQLCYIMYRYRTNLVTAKTNERQIKAQMHLNIHSHTFQEFNKYLTAMVGCLWTSQAFHQDTHPQGIHLETHLLESSGVSTYKKAFNIVYHPALIGYSVHFYHQVFSKDKLFRLQSIKGRLWNKYLDFLYSQGLNGLKLFIESSVNRLASNSQQQEPCDLLLSKS